MKPMDDVLRKVIEDAQSASEAALTPERLAAYDKAEARQRRRDFIDAAAPAIETDIRDAIVRGDALTATHSLNVVRRWHEVREAGKGWPRVLILCSGTGTGKTVAAAWMLAREPGRYVVTADAVRWRRMAEAEWFKVKRCHLLVLDDLGTETDAAAEKAMFFELINHRLGGGWTLVTTNMDKAALAGWLDARTSSRIEAVGLVQEINGGDMRRRATEAAQ